MTFAEAVALLRRRKLLAVYGVLAALLLATLAAYRVDGAHLVGRTPVSYKTTAVVAIRPGVEKAPVGGTAPPPVTTIQDAPAVPSGTTVPSATIASPPLAPLSAAIDSRAMYYTALSLRTVVLSPGFAEAVRADVPEMDGSLSALVAQDTNTMTIVVDGSTEDIARSSMQATLRHLESVVAAYSATPATRFELDGVVISEPSEPVLESSIRDRLTFVLVLTMVLVVWWYVIRAAESLRLHGARRREHGKAIPLEDVSTTSSAVAIPPPSAAPGRAATATPSSIDGRRSRQGTATQR